MLRKATAVLGLWVVLCAVLDSGCTAEAYWRERRGTSGSRMSFEDRVEFLTAHNEMRRQVDPPAGDMQKMVWSEELAASAQSWADECVFKHHWSTVADWGDGSYTKRGENMWANKALTPPSPTKVVTGWFDEKEGYDYATTSCNAPAPKVCTHYTQLVWAKSYELGCAYTFCPELGVINVENANLFVCHYGPRGNKKDTLPYTYSTTPCAHCATGTSCEGSDPAYTPALCETPECGGKICLNGGVLHDDTCECDCPPDHNGPVCQYIDTVPDCLEAPPPDTCIRYSTEGPTLDVCTDRFTCDGGDTYACTRDCHPYTPDLPMCRELELLGCTQLWLTQPVCDSWVGWGQLVTKMFCPDGSRFCFWDCCCCKLMQAGVKSGVEDNCPRWLQLESYEKGFCARQFYDYDTYTCIGDILP